MSVEPMELGPVVNADIRNRQLEDRVIHLEAALVRVLKFSDRERNQKLSEFVRAALNYDC